MERRGLKAQTFALKWVTRKPKVFARGLEDRAPLPLGWTSASKHSLKAEQIKLLKGSLTKKNPVFTEDRVLQRLLKGQNIMTTRRFLEDEENNFLTIAQRANTNVKADDSSRDSGNM